METEELVRAVKAGVIDQATADRLQAFFAPNGEAANLGGEDEQLRLVSGFGDIFVAIGLVLFLGALGFLTMNQHPVVAPAAVAIASWGLAELFTRQRRQALPSILLLIVFTAAFFLAVTFLFDVSERVALSSWIGDSKTVAASGFATCAAVALHWWRFQVPVTIAAACAAGAATLLSLLETVIPGVVSKLGGFIFLPIGLAIFFLALRIDNSDRQRRTRRTDIAFWLHALAAPMVVHPVMQGVMDGSTSGLGGAALTVLVFLVLGSVALVVDRRAMLVSSLIYLGYAIYSLLQAGNLLPSTSLVVLLVGAVVLGLSLAWRPLRAALLGVVPGAIVNVVPPAHITSLKTG